MISRRASLHLKDIAQDAPTATSEGATKPAHRKEVASGHIHWTAVLASARKARVRHYFVEQDYTPAQPVECARKSFEYLQQPAA